MNTLDTAARAGLSRRTLLKGAGATGLGIALAQAGSLAPVAAQAEDLQTILNITATTEAFGVTALGGAIASAEQGNYNRPIPAPVLDILRAARAQEQFHLDYFRSIGGELLTDTFTVPPALLTDYDTFFATLVELEARETAAQIAAMMTFTQLGLPELAKASFQYAAEESEHRVLANYALGVRPPNDNAFAPALYGSVSEHLAFLEQAGLIGGGGTAVTYPGPGEIDASGVTNTEPDGPVVTCAQGVAGGTGGGRRNRDNAQTGVGGGGRDDGMTMPNVGVGSASRAADGRALGVLAGLAGVGTAALAMRARRAEPAATEEA